MAYRSARRTNGACEFSASLTRRTMPAYVLSAAVPAARRSNGPPVFTTPLRTRSRGRARQAGLTGQRGLIENRGDRGDRAVDRHDVTRRHQQEIASRDGVERHDLDIAVPVSAGGARRPVQQCAQIVPRAQCRPGLQGPAAGQHHADHRGGQQLAHRDRARQRQQRDQVHPEPPAADAVDGRPHRVGETEPRRHQPARVRAPGRPRQQGQSAARQPGSGHDQQEHRRPPAEPAGRRAKNSAPHTSTFARANRQTRSPTARRAGTSVLGADKGWTRFWLE